MEQETDWKELYIHTLADFDNFRKNSEKIRAGDEINGKKELIKKLIPVLDALFLAEKSQDIPEGMKHIFTEFLTYSHE